MLRCIHCADTLQTHQDQLFFEAVYSALAAVIHEALGSFKSRQDIDVEVKSSTIGMTVNNNTTMSRFPARYMQDKSLSLYALLMRRA